MKKQQTNSTCSLHGQVGYKPPVAREIFQMYSCDLLQVSNGQNLNMRDYDDESDESPWA